MIYNDEIQNQSYYGGEHRLLVAIITNAIIDATDRDEVVRSEALTWIREDSQIPFSCTWICEHIDIDKNYLERMIEKIQGGDLGRNDLGLNRSPAFYKTHKK